MNLFKNCENIIKINNQTKTTIVGDLHGQFANLVHIFQTFGWPERKQDQSNDDHIYIFCGDYVDRGFRSIHTVLLLLILKLLNKDSIYLLRGNHETIAVNTSYGFLKECQQVDKSQTDALYNSFNILFQYYPIAAILNEQFFCVHGGLTPQLQQNTVSSLQLLNRRCEPYTFTPISDLLWSDPVEGQKDQYIENYRGSGFMFNKEAAHNFLQRNGLKAIIRSHQVSDGYQELLDGQVLLVWSAPNYCYKQINKASVLQIIPRQSEQEQVETEINQQAKDYEIVECCCQSQEYHLIWNVYKADTWQDEEAKLSQGL